MKRIVGVGIVALSVLLVSQPAWAVRTRFHVAAESQQYGEKAGGMIARGLLNVATSFMDVLVTTVNETKAGPPFIGTLKGLAVGTGCGVLRVGSGVVDIATFWVPGFNGFPVSDAYDDCLTGAQSTAWMGEVEPAPKVVEPIRAPLIAPAESLVQTAEPAEAAVRVEPAEPRKAWKK